MKVVLSWLLFWIGHFISIPMQAFDWAFLYRVYCWLMVTSQDLDEHEKVWTRYDEQRCGLDMTNSDKRIMDIVNQQGESKTLWVTHMTSVEAHLQKELRRLHAFLEFEIEEKADKTGYMCGAGFHHEIESHDACIYVSADLLKTEEPCWRDCGIVKVSVEIIEEVCTPNGK